MNDSPIRAKRMELLRKHFQTRFVEDLKRIPSVSNATLITHDMDMFIGVDDGPHTKVDSVLVDYSEGKKGLFEADVIAWFRKVFADFGVTRDLTIRFGRFYSKHTTIISSFPEMWIDLQIELDEVFITNLLNIEPQPHVRIPGRKATLCFVEPDSPYLEAHVVDDDYWDIKHSKG